MRCSVTRPSFLCATLCLIFLLCAGAPPPAPVPSRPSGRSALFATTARLQRRLRSLLRGRRRLIDPHAEAQAHGVQDFLDLVQALPPEVLRLEHLGLGLLHQLANRADVRVLEAVVRSNGELQLLDALVEVLIADADARQIARRFGLLLGTLFEVDE